MDMIRIAGASINQIPFDWEGNCYRIVKLIEEAKQHGCHLICFPELSVSAYNCEDMFLSVETARQAIESLGAILVSTEDIITVLGMPIYHRGSMYNCAVVCQNKRIIGISPKKLLAREGLHYESRWFRAWPFHRVETIRIFDQTVPIGDLSYQFGQLQMGVVICEEAWSSEGTSSDATLSRAELLVNLSASHFALGKAKTRENLVVEASRSFQAIYLYTNLLGLEAGRSLYDGEIILGECGKITARSQRFSLNEGQLLIRAVDLDKARVGKLKNRSVLDATNADSSAQVAIGDALIDTANVSYPIPPELQGLEKDGYQTRELEFVAAQKLGLFDYLRKSNSQGFMLSLSGGCDSSAIAVLCAHTIAEALKELGPESLALKLNWSYPKGPSDQASSWLRERLSCLYQGTSQSSETTRLAAKQLAESLGAEFLEVEVQDLVDAYCQKAKSLTGRDLSWANDDLSLQNIQARARAPMVWLLANMKQFLLLATSNRSEVAVGYATMDGDTAGGLAPLSGIDKHFLRNWLRWAETSCPLGIGPVASLSLVNSQAPTAELRPLSAQQKDEADLMPYEILNVIEGAFVRDRMEPYSILMLLLDSYPNIEGIVLRSYLEKFYKLWAQNQWKRERYAPGFQLDDYSLDPKSWCRYPILSAVISVPGEGCPREN